ncbi:DUF3253 domain-containing protein [Pseudarthrobacter phenanthrenivorans]|uniref:DUF3253 domain-containing protein n=1 Tax=Pseudarthrobacter phenanthrenivorans TaxID=361575 RepID=A0A3B0G3V3_PSEPS|nr:DUF3253 domain-containing protein [Pseudarthrobacter phenanthrenivorans]RKO26825.1 DUF3253 domain-containing protein [Pseudarthrobacter phenanthrenivorans]
MVGGARSGAAGPDDSLGRRLEESILELLAARAATSTICPSEAARAVGGEDWRDAMGPAREAARRLVAAGEVEITQGGSVVDPATARGPIRIRRARRGTEPAGRPTPFSLLLGEDPAAGT